MPTSVRDERPKRKRESAGDAPKKRRRSSDDESEDSSERVLLMEQGILASKKNYNDITTLVEIAREYREGNEESLLATVTLCRVFVRLFAQDAFIKKSSGKDAVVVGWLKDQLSQYKVILLSLLREHDIATTALTLCMRILKAEGEHISNKEEYAFPRTFLEAIVATIIASKSDTLMKTYIGDFAEQYDDIRFYTFSSVKAALQGAKSDNDSGELFTPAFALLSVLDGVPGSAEELEDFYVPRPKKKDHNLRSVTQHKKQGQEAWLSLMSIVKTRDQRKRILDIMSSVIAPWFTKPELLADFLTNCYNAGGSMSLLALSGVFYLIQQRNLDYPSFYPKLYSLLDRDILHSKHRSRFFRLLDTFLASTHLPAALVASFLKRLSRLALNAPPGAIVFLVPWIYNILKRHPLCTFMIQRETRDPDEKERIQEQGLEDPFLSEETDPMTTKAMDSSLWELVQLQSHYHPNVATISKIVSEQFTKVSYNVEDFLDHSYATLLDAEMAKDIKKAPVVEFHVPKRVFLPQDLPAETPDSLLVRLWDFQGLPPSTQVA